MTHDDLKAAAAEAQKICRDAAPHIAQRKTITLLRTLADYAAAMLDETPIDRAWLAKLLGEADPSSSPSDAWWPLAGSEGVGVYWDDDAWCMYLDEDVYWVVSTRADALAFFKLVRWPVEVGKILEGAK